MRNSLALAWLCGGWLFGQAPAERTSFRINFADDAPVALVSADWGESRATARGGALLVDLHASLTLRNSGWRRICGIALVVQAQAVTPGGRGSVTVPSLDVASGETFPVRVDLRLLRPLAPGGGPAVEVALDGVLFDDLTFYGPNRLNSRRSMTLWEVEARRDRRYFRQILEAKGSQGLQREVVAAMARQAERPRVDMEVVRRAPATAAGSAEGSQVQFSFLQMPDAPVETLSGAASISAGEVRAPAWEVRNRSRRPVRYFEMGWLVRDRQGRQFHAGALPVDLSGRAPGGMLAPGAVSRIAQEGALRFSTGPGGRLEIDVLSGFVERVEFDDGGVWVMNWEGASELRAMLAPSPEEQRLLELYKRKGLEALVRELRK